MGGVDHSVDPYSGSSLERVIESRGRTRQQDGPRVVGKDPCHRQTHALGARPDLADVKQARAGQRDQGLSLDGQRAQHNGNGGTVDHEALLNLRYHPHPRPHRLVRSGRQVFILETGVRIPLGSLFMVGHPFSCIAQGLLATALLMAPAFAGPQGVVATTASPAATASHVDATIRIVGRVEQSTRLPAPQDGLLEVFVRQSDGTLVVAIVPETDADAIAVDTTVDFAGRPDGTQTYRARDGGSRTVPRLIAVDAPVAVAGAVDDLNVMLGILVLLMAGFGVLTLVIGRSRMKVSRVLDDDSAVADCDFDDLDGTLLPEDPSDALAELARRNEAGDE